MAQLPETRILAGGIDSNAALSAIGKESYINAVNVRALASDDQESGELNFLDGNIEVAAVTAQLFGGTNTLLGKWASVERGCLYMVYHSSASGGYILEYNVVTNSARRVLTDAKVTGGLGLLAPMFVSVRVVDNKLFWANINIPTCCLNLDVNYMAGPTLALEDIMLIKAPPALPLVPNRVTNVGAASTIQFTNVQFAWRFINSDGFVTVLSPRSDTSYATRQAELVGSTDFGNAVDIDANPNQKVPANWRYVEYIAYFPDNAAANQFYVIKRWSSSEPADVTAVNNHNNAIAQLKLFNWDGTLLELLDSPYTAKPFDNVPISSSYLEAAANRLFLANNIAGYDTPTVKPAITVTPTTFLPTVPSAPATACYIVMWYNGAGKWYYATIYRDLTAGLNYLLPKEYGCGVIKADAPFPNTSVLGDKRPLLERISTLPFYVPKQQLTLLNETRDPGIAFPLTHPSNGAFVPPWTGELSLYGGTSGFNNLLEPRYNIVEEAHQAGLVYDATAYGSAILANFGFVHLEDAPNEYGPTGQKRAFKSGSVQYGVQYFDGQMRKSGVLSCGVYSIPTLAAPSGGFALTSFTEKLSLAMPPGVQTCIPTWARYYCLTLTYNQKCSRFIQLSAGIVHPVIMNQDDELEFADTALLVGAIPLGQSLYGLAIPLSALHRDNLGYSFSPGDFIEYGTEVAGSFVFTGQAPIKEVWGNHIIVPYVQGQNMEYIASGLQKDFSFEYRTASTSPFQWFFTGSPTGSHSAQEKVMINICSPQTDISQYEVAQFGKIVNPGANNRSFGTFARSGTLTATILGDAHVHKRESNSGGFTGLSMNAYEIGATTRWVTDNGRIAPVDRIGQKHLTNQIAFSNANIPDSSTNGYASFDALDVKTVEENAGPITGLSLTTRGTEAGAQVVAYCTAGMFTALVGQQQLTDASGNDNITLAASVIDNFKATTGDYGTSIPRSIMRHQFHVWATDLANKAQTEFNASGTQNIGHGLTRILRQALARVAGTLDEPYVSCGVNPYTQEMMLSIPSTGLASGIPQVDLNTAPGFAYPFDAYTNLPATWIYSYEKNLWPAQYQSGAEFMNIGNEVFGWHAATGKLWHEFVGAPGSYYGTAATAMIAVPFNEGGASKTPLSLLLVARRAPDQCWVMCDDGIQHVATVEEWKHVEGGWETNIRRDRTSFGASNLTDWEDAGIEGDRLKGRVVNVVMVWNAAGGPIRASTLTLHSNMSLGQTKSPAS